MSGFYLKPNKKIQSRPGEKLRKEDPRILLGVTGGVASGKTTVARMIEDLGAPTIDFDHLSRVVVEPHKPAWKEIQAYFGKQVLRADNTLDRGKLAQIVFRDPAKRKKLESFLHPRIFNEFTRRAKAFKAKDPHAIIQVVVPLLFEAQMQDFFDKILLVYIPPAMQTDRLIKRDRISMEMAENIINAQWPMEEKKGYADFIVDNSGTLGETKRQVREVWRELKRMQKERSKG